MHCPPFLIPSLNSTLRTSKPAIKSPFLITVHSENSFCGVSVFDLIRVKFYDSVINVRRHLLYPPFLQELFKIYLLTASANYFGFLLQL
jgi:hypothetical protein